MRGRWTRSTFLLFSLDLLIATLSKINRTIANSSTAPSAKDGGRPPRATSCANSASNPQGRESKPPTMLSILCQRIKASMLIASCPLRSRLWPPKVCREARALTRLSTLVSVVRASPSSSAHPMQSEATASLSADETPQPSEGEESSKDAES